MIAPDITAGADEPPQSGTSRLLVLVPPGAFGEGVADAAAAAMPGATIRTAGPGEARAADLDVDCVAVTIGSPLVDIGLGQLADLRDSDPSLPLIAIIEHPDLAEVAFAHGARDVLPAHTLDGDSLAVAVRLALARPRSGTSPQAHLSDVSRSREPFIEAEHGRLTFANEATRHLLGYPSEDALVATPLGEIFFDPSDASGLSDLVGSVGPVVGYGTALRHYNGRLVPVNISAYPSTPDGTRWLASILDQTEQRRHELSQSHSEERHRFLTSATPVGLLEVDLTPISLWFERLRAAGVTDFRSHVREHLHVVDGALKLVSVLSANPAAKALFDSETPRLNAAIAETEENEARVIDLLNALWSDKLQATSVLTLRRPGRRDANCSVQITIPTNSGRPDYTRVLVTLSDVTKQMVTERSLIMAIRSFRAAFDQAPIAMLTVTSDGTVSEANGASLRLLVRPLGSVQGTFLAGLIHPEDRVRVQAVLAQVLDGRGTGECIARVLRPDGTPRSTRLFAALVQNAFDDDDHMVVQILDVTDETTALIERTRAEQRFENVFHNAPGGMAILGPDGTIIAANDQLTDVAGAPPHATSARSLLGGLSAFDRHRVIELWREVITDRTSAHVPLARLDSPDGSTRWVSVKLQYSRGTPTADACVICQVVDETETVHARIAAETSHSKFRALFEHSPVPMFDQDITEIEAKLELLRRADVTDLREFLAAHPEAVHELFSELRIVDANRAAVELLEASHKDDLVGNISMDTVTEETRDALVEQLVGIWNGVTDMQLRLVGRSMNDTPIDGELLWILRPPGHPQRNRAIVAIVDLYDQRRLQRRVEEVVRSSDEFLAAVSHQLRTPLTAVVGFAEEINTAWDVLSDDDRREYVHAVADEGMALARTIEDLLVAARIDLETLALEKVPVDVDEMIRRTCASVAPLAAGIEITGDGSTAFADPRRVSQILRHLLMNAAQHGGSQIQVNAQCRDADVEIIVRDNGSGIPDEERERVFERGVRLASSADATAALGFGLPVARDLARALGGDLHYRYTGDGSEFVLELPRPDLRLTTDPTAPSPSGSNPEGSTS